MELEYPLWRIWIETGISVQEIMYEWTLTDVLKANAMLDMKESYKNAIQSYYKVKEE